MSRTVGSSRDTLLVSIPPVTRERSSVRIVIADDHLILRDGLRRLLETQPDFLVVGEVGDGPSALRAALDLKPDILLLDMALPGCSGLDVLAALREAGSSLHVILLTASVDRSDIVKAFQLGARGFVLKESPSSRLFASIRTVADGQTWMDQDTVSSIMQAFSMLQQAKAAETVKDFSLTRRERQIVNLVVQGYTNRDISKELSVGEDTVKHHLTNIFDKTGVSSRLELALFSIHHGLVANTSAPPSSRLAAIG